MDFTEVFISDKTGFAAGWGVTPRRPKEFYHKLLLVSYIPFGH